MSAFLISIISKQKKCIHIPSANIVNHLLVLVIFLLKKRKEHHILILQAKSCYVQITQLATYLNAKIWSFHHFLSAKKWGTGGCES